MTLPRIAAVALVVPDYDAAIRFFVDGLGFRLTEDIPQGRKRWVTVEPAGGGLRLVLAQAEGARTVLAIVAFGALASFGAIFLELASAKGGGAASGGHVG